MTMTTNLTTTHHTIVLRPSPYLLREDVSVAPIGIETTASSPTMTHDHHLHHQLHGMMDRLAVSGSGGGRGVTGRGGNGGGVGIKSTTMATLRQDRLPAPSSLLCCLAYIPCAAAAAAAAATATATATMGSGAVVMPIAGAAQALPPFCVRANTSAVYGDLNRYLARTYSTLTPIKVGSVVAVPSAFSLIP